MFEIQFLKIKKNLFEVNFTYKSTSMVHFMTSTLKINAYMQIVYKYTRQEKTDFHSEIDISEYCSSITNLEIVFHKLGEIIKKSMEKQSVK